MLNLLSEDQVRVIDAAVMEILSEIGLDVASDLVRSILVRAGGRSSDRRVRLPRDLVRRSIQSAPREFPIVGRDANRKILIGDGKTHVQPMVGRLHILDPDGTKRLTTLSDLGRIVRVCNGLPHYDILHGGSVMPQIADVPGSLAHVAGFVQTVRNTGKPFKGSCRGRQIAEDCLRLAQAVSEVSDTSIPLHTTCNLVSPLHMAADMTEGALEYIRRGFPVDFASEPQSGATSPVTLAGTLAQSLAESLAGVVLAQVVNPGSPVFVGTVAAALDMRHTTIALGGVEGAMINAAHAQMAAFYGLPSRGTGSNTNSKRLDYQAGYEKMMTLLLPMLAGVDLLFYPGTLEHAETVSLESLVLDHDLCAMALHAQKGMRTAPDLLAVELIRQIGPGGTFLGLPQTAKAMFTEHLPYGLWDRRRRSDWNAAGSPTCESTARKEVERLLNEPASPLPEVVENRLYEAVRDIARRENHPQLLDQLWPEGGPHAGS